MTKVCRKCTEEKEVSEFYLIQSGKQSGKLHSYCRICCRANVRKSTRKKPEGYLERTREWLNNNPDKKLRYGMRRYGVDEVWYKESLAAQNGVCAICKRGESQRKWRGRLSVDHDHVTGANRGLLCNTCNMRLAGLESQDWFVAAQAYLTKYKQL